MIWPLTASYGEDLMPLWVVSGIYCDLFVVFYLMIKENYLSLIDRLLFLCFTGFWLWICLLTFLVSEDLSSFGTSPVMMWTNFVIYAVNC